MPFERHGQRAIIATLSVIWLRSIIIMQYFESDKLIASNSPAVPSPARSFWFNLSTSTWRTFCLPVTFTLSSTVPDCRTRRKLYPFTFGMSIIWISVVTYVLSWMLTICGRYDVTCWPTKHYDCVALQVSVFEGGFKTFTVDPQVIRSA